ncbi:MAG: hypothetical protein KDA96_26915 [Planctomycetaceae bacterium]|nr:hypothetical protein [Planctomycetaceae bacterium]MCA9066740.1 hypothetical protein [Planctomycetaceae bacterium]
MIDLWTAVDECGRSSLLDALHVYAVQVLIGVPIAAWVLRVVIRLTNKLPGKKPETSLAS